MVGKMICMLCKHDKTEHTSTKVFHEDWTEHIDYCWECNKQWPPKFKTDHIFMDNLKYLEIKSMGEI